MFIMSVSNSTDVAQSCFVDVADSTIHYRELGTGRPIVFLHGMPVSSYLWRNIMPSLAKYGRCIAPDLIGMGDSGKPNIEYSVADHIHYISEFLKKLDLTDIVFVLHGWGSVVGFEYARQHHAQVSGLAFFESHIRPAVDWDMLSLPVQQLSTLLLNEDASHTAIVKQNYLIKRLLPSSSSCKLPSDVLAEYQKPFLTESSRAPLWQYVKDLPLGRGHTAAIDIIAGYSAWLQQTDIPKLMLYAMPGFITTISAVQWAKDNLSNLDIVCLEDVLHFPQETCPEIFSQFLVDWYLEKLN